MERVPINPAGALVETLAPPQDYLDESGRGRHGFRPDMDVSYALGTGRFCLTIGAECAERDAHRETAPQVLHNERPNRKWPGHKRSDRC
jgi:hypothetical protein